MDPASAALTAIAALATLADTLIKSQPPDVSKAIWERIDDHITWLRKLVHLPPV